MKLLKFKQTEIGMIPEEWEEDDLGNYCEVKSGKRLPKESFLVEYKTNYPYIRVRNLENMTVKVDELLYLDEGTHLKISRYIINKDDIYISIVGTIGLVGLIPQEIDGANLTENCARLTNLKKVDKEFLTLYLNSKVGQEQIKSLIVGTTQEKLALHRIKQIKIPIPSLEEQKNISKILFDFNRKITINYKINKTLEAIGQAIFKQWFIDFEFPNEKGKPYKSSSGEMVDSELGEIPKGWRVGKYEDLVFLSTGKGLKRDEFVEQGKYAVLGANGELGRTDNFLFDEKLILTGRVGTLGTVYLIRGKVWISDNVLISKPKSNENYYYSYFTIRTFDFQSLNRGSTQPLITQTDLKNQTVIMSDNQTLSLFHKICLNLFDKIYQNELQNIGLSQIRDSLLPKLMSGKIRVPVEVK